MSEAVHAGRLAQPVGKASATRGRQRTALEARVGADLAPAPGLRARAGPLVVGITSGSFQLLSALEKVDTPHAGRARAGVPEYWVADVNGRVIHQMGAPVDDANVERREVAFGAQVEASTRVKKLTGTELYA